MKSVPLFSPPLTPRFPWLVPVWLWASLRPHSLPLATLPHTFTGWFFCMSHVCVCLCSVMSNSLQFRSYILQESSVYVIFQARILEWVAISHSRGSFQPRDWNHISCISCIGRLILYHYATWEAPHTRIFLPKLFTWF